MRSKYFLFNCKDENKEVINFKELDTKTKEIMSFYNFQLKEKIRVNFVYSIKEYEDISSESFQSWKCGFHKNKEIYVFSPLIIEEVGIHKKEEIECIILHEFSHIIFRLKNLEPIPLFDEGLAEYFGQYEQKMKQTRNFNFKEIDSAMFLMGSQDKGQFYLISFYVIKLLLDNFSKEKLLLFLTELRTQKNKDFETFRNKFKEHFKIEFEDLKNLKIRR